MDWYAPHDTDLSFPISDDIDLMFYRWQEDSQDNTGKWYVRFGRGSFRTFFDAVIDDYGDLVAVRSYGHV